MNTKNLKAYAPKARRQFIEAVQKRAAHFGIYEDRIVEAKEEGSSTLIEGRVFTKQQGQQRKRLAQRVEERGYEMFTREMAYTWFNRLAAIRYMEIHDYLEHGFRVLSNPNNNESLPEILDHASDVADTLELDKSHIIELQLAGDKEEELYRELLLGQCHYLAKIMPFVFKGLAFEAIDDATELLLPDNLTKTDSILKGLINEIPEEDWSEIEVVGWLYQFYISEHKDSVMGKVVKSEDIPAATQLFTPNWIVKYLVQNSLGRHWLATYPGSELKGKMEYYIEPAEQSDEVIEQLKAITPASIDPEEIKIIDPAVGSGHILVEVYEVLRDIYLERGYRLREIPELILTKNIYGLDIDDRAAQLAGFALMMKAREDDRRIFQRVQDGEVTLNIYSLQSTESLDIPTLWRALDLEGNQQQGSTGGLFDSSEEFIEPSGIYKEYYKLLQTLKSVFLQAKTLGSLIQIENSHLANVVALKELLQTKEQGSDPAAKQAAIELLPVINQATILAQRYISTIMNPPYLGSKGMNAELKEFAKKQFPNSKSDLFALFMERAFGLLSENGYNAQVNMQSWMFLSSYESLREWLLDTKTFVTMAHLGARAFAQISGEVVQTTAWILKKVHINHYQPVFNRLINGNEEEKRKALIKQENRFENTEQNDFNKIPGSPIAYWTEKNLVNIFEEIPSIENYWLFRQGMATSDNERFLRMWYEVPHSKVDTNCKNSDDLKESSAKWFPYNKGGSFRKWYGNNELVVNWEHDGKEMKDFTSTLNQGMNVRLKSREYYCLPNITYSALSSGDFGCRVSPPGFLFDTKGSCLFSEKESVYKASALLNSSFAKECLSILCPTLDFNMVGVKKVPYIDIDENESLAKRAVEVSKTDWDKSEISWQFIKSPLFINHKMISESCKEHIHLSEEAALELKLIEEKINRNIANAFSLKNLEKQTVPIENISLNNNKKFIFGTTNEQELIPKFINKLIVDLCSYSLGCMMGRYSLDREGLTYALSGNEGFKELAAEGAYQSFSADDDGIVPLASEDWLFDDDATARFKEFVKTVWGKEHLDENLEFVAESLCLHALKPKKGEGAMDTVRRYFSTQFFKDHCKTYKKRPIYWLFSSGKEKAFECLVYLHRYNEGTLSRMRTEYVTPLMGKFDAQHTLLSEQQIQATGTEARRIEKELKTLDKKQAELRTFDEQLKHYAEKRITLDLDDGVKANYGKFGNLLADVKAIHGSAPKVVK
jgi:type II restriction/modification system DNA methylase subunit YeeA